VRADRISGRLYAQHATPIVRRIAAAAGYARVLSYDVDSRDFTDPGAVVIRRNVASVKEGSVVSLHLGHPGTLDALPGVLDDLAAPAGSAPSRPPLSSPVKGLDVSARSMAIRAPSVEAMATPAPTPVSGTALPGMPTVTDPHNVYAAAV